MNDEIKKPPPIFDNSLYRLRIVRPIAKKIAPILVKFGLSGNGVCWLKLVLGLAGSIMLASIDIAVCLLGIALMQFYFLLDAADGEVARLIGEAGYLSGEYFDKLADHLPKTAMYFFWGIGGWRISDSMLPLYCGAFFALWNIYPRFCAVETLLERLDKAPEILNNNGFQRAIAAAFVTEKNRGKTDYWLTVFVHPALNALTLLFICELIIPFIIIGGNHYHFRVIGIIIFTLAGIWNFLRKGLRYFKLLNFD